MQSRRKILTLVMIGILTLIPLGQAGLTATAAPDAEYATPSILTTVTGVGSTPTGIAVDEINNKIYVSSLGGNHLTRINGTSWAKAYSATAGVVYHPMGLSVDPSTQRVYVSNGAQHLSIVNGNTLTLIKAVDMGAGNAQLDVVVHPSLGYAFATDFSHSRAYAVNINSYAKSNIANLAPGGTRIALSPDGKAAYVTCYSSNSVDVIDTARREIVARYFEHYNQPVGIAVNPSNGYLYVANSGNSTVKVVDDRNDLQHTISVAGTGAVKGVAYNPNTDHIFITRNGTPGHVYVYDGTSYALIQTLTVQNDPDAYIAVDTVRDRVYVTNQNSGSVSVIQDAGAASTAKTPPAARHPATEAPTPATDEPSPIPCPVWITDTIVGNGPQGIAVDDTNLVAYVANSTSNTVSRVNLVTNQVDATSSSIVVAGPTALAVNPSTRLVYVANGTSTNISILDGASPTLAQVGFIALLQKPKYVLLAPSANRAYVLNHSDDLSKNYLTEIDMFASSKIRDISLGANTGPYAMALSSDREIAYISCHNSSAYGGSFLSIVDMSLGKDIGQLFTHYSQPTGIVMDPVRDRMYVANEGGDGKVVAVDHRNLLKDSVTLGGKPRGLALNPNFNRLAVVQKDSNAVAYVDTLAFTPSCPPIFTMTADRWVAFSSAFNRFYVSRSGGNTMAVIQDYIGDGYESDDSYSLAKFILNDTPQTHSIDPVGDVDWVKLVVNEPITPTISTTDTYSTVYTTTLTLYDTDGATALVTDTNPIMYALPAAGTYYVKVKATDSNVGDASYTYELLVTGGHTTYRISLPLVMTTED